MAKEQGTVRQVQNKPFCFIQRQSGGDVFCHSKEYPTGQTPADGDSVEFEVENAPKGPRVKQGTLNVLSKVVSAPAVTQVRTPQPAQNNVPVVPAVSSAPPFLDVVVEFLYDIKRFGSSPDEFELPIVISVTTPDRTPVRGAKVDLSCAGQQVEMPAPCPYTDKHGEAHFQIVYYRTYDQTTGQPGPPLNITSLALAVKVTQGGKELVQSETAPRSADLQVQTVPASPKFTVKENEVGGQKQYLVGYGTPGATVPATFEVWPTRGCEISVCDGSQLNWQTTTGGKLGFPSNGQSVLKVKIEKLAPGVGGENIFIATQGTVHQSGPHYISGIK